MRFYPTRSFPVEDLLPRTSTCPSNPSCSTSNPTLLVSPTMHSTSFRPPFSYRRTYYSSKSCPPLPTINRLPSKSPPPPFYPDKISSFGTLKVLIWRPWKVPKECEKLYNDEKTRNLTIFADFSRWRLFIALRRTNSTPCRCF